MFESRAEVTGAAATAVDPAADLPDVGFDLAGSGIDDVAFHEFVFEDTDGSGFAGFGFDVDAGCRDWSGTRPLTTAEVVAFIDRLGSLDRGVSDAERVDQLRAFERLDAVTAAQRAKVTVDFAASQEAAQRAAGVPEARVGRGVAAQVGLARRISHARAVRYLGWARVLVGELPVTFAALAAGDTSEWRALLLARETIWLADRSHREAIDAELGPRLGSLGDRQVEAEARKLGYRLDPHGFLARSRAAAKDRRVWVRPAPDTMTKLTALLPVGQGVACYAALKAASDAARASGDERGTGQVMADTLVERITGQAGADDVDVTVHLVMTDQTLLGNHDTDDHDTDDHDVDEDDTDYRDDGDDTGDRDDLDGADVGAGAGPDEPGVVVGYGPVPAGIARDLARGTARSRVWVRRMFRRPRTGQLAAIDARRRVFDGPIRDAVIARDQLCRTPWCNAPIQHADHTRPVSQDGPTTMENGAGLCQACNYAKTAPGWRARPGPDGTSDEIIITTPTGHTYTSRPPDLPSQRAGPSSDQS